MMDPANPNEMVFKEGGQWTSILNFSPSLLAGYNMIRYPCKTCVVVACCTETCYDIAAYWKHVYESFRDSPEKTIADNGLSKEHAKTLKSLYDAAGHRPVVFTPNKDVLTISIDFSIYQLSSINDPPRPMEAKLHDSKKPM